MVAPREARSRLATLAPLRHQARHPRRRADLRHRGILLAERIRQQPFRLKTGFVERLPHEPRVPDFARELKPDIRQLHSSQYRNPAQLRSGAVLVVGACNSGAEIAFDVAREHRTWLSGRDTGHIPINPGSRAYQVFGHLMSFLGSRLLTVDTPLGRKARPKFRAGGGPLIRVKPVHLRAAGVERVLARTVGTRDGLPLLDDGRVLDVANVIWCVGYEHTARWIEVPIDRDDGWPQQQRGVVPSAPGLYFIGLPFLYSINSSLVVGVERDAAHLADQIVSRAAVSRRVRRGCDMDRGKGSDGMVGASAVRDDLTSDGG
jgi:putative flavoprotein involved in K+ transport